LKLYPVKKQIILVLSLLLFLASIIMLGYFLPRSAFIWQLSLYGLAFLTYWIIYNCSLSGMISLSFGFGMAFLFRVSLLFAVPSLSDDFYRFIFDGYLIQSGISPYCYLPDVAIGQLDIQPSMYRESLMEGMNSRLYYSIYPPFHQFFFWLSALAGESLLGNILILRLVVLFFEGLNLFLLYKIIRDWNLPESKLWLYAYNPLVILELSGNLHFEGIVLSGLLVTVYFFGKNKLILSNLGWASAIGVKLTPLMFGPLLLKSWDKNKRWKFLSISAAFLFIFFWPLLMGDVLGNFWQSFRLYQSKFEFNASIYYLIRWLSGFFIDYNPIVYVGPFLNWFALLIILVISYFKKIEKPGDLVQAMVWIYLSYLLLQTVVHPWYIIPAFGISVLTKNRVFLVWTGLVFLSYSAYANEPCVVENRFLLLLEYMVLAGFIIWKYLRRFVST
jgi:alpha-1,6-mannosyltransferase